MDFTNIEKSQPIHPYINPDGYWAQCKRCWNEVYPTDKICLNCQQAQDWSWLNKE